MTYDQEYFERGAESGKSLYSNYRWIPELTIPLAHEIVKICEIKEDDLVLDYGCAKGFLVKALRLLHIKALGVDISDYALSQAPSDVKEHLTRVWLDAQYDVIIAKDVLEHLDDKSLDETISMMRKFAKKLFVMVPLGDGEKYLIESYENDKTHVQRRSLSWWKDKITSFGFDVDARYQWGHIKQNWISVNPLGNGFFLCK